MCPSVASFTWCGVLNASGPPPTAHQGAGASLSVGPTMPSAGDLVQVPWGRKLWCVSVVGVRASSNSLVVDWHGFPNWKNKKARLVGVRHPLPRGASCVGVNACCPSHDMITYVKQCNQEPGCACTVCAKWNHSDECCVCGEGGKVMMCEGCATVAHYGCMGLPETPVAPWLCPACRPAVAVPLLPWPEGRGHCVLSLFDGIAIGRQALVDLGFVHLGGYHAFELLDEAMQVAGRNHNDITQHGDVRQVQGNKGQQPQGGPRLHVDVRGQVEVHHATVRVPHHADAGGVGL